jgi:hypothetical protein
METTTNTTSLDINGIINRCKLVILSPKECWQTIARESHTPKELLRATIVPLMVAGILCSTIGMQVFGMNLGSLGTWRPPFVQYLLAQVAFGIVGVVVMFISSLILQKLAVYFQGSVTPERAFSLLAHAMLPMLVGNMVANFPLLGIFAIVFSIISLCALYHGSTVMTTVPSSKTLGFIAAFIVSMILVSVIIYGAMALMVPALMVPALMVPQPPL